MINLREIIAQYIYEMMIILQEVNRYELGYDNEFKCYYHKPEYDGGFKFRPIYPVVVFDYENIEFGSKESWINFIYKASMDFTEERQNEVFKELHDGLEFLIDLENNKNPNHRLEPFEILNKYVQPYNPITIKYSIKKVG